MLLIWLLKGKFTIIESHMLSHFNLITEPFSSLNCSHLVWKLKIFKKLLLLIKVNWPLNLTWIVLEISFSCFLFFLKQKFFFFFPRTKMTSKSKKKIKLKKFSFCRFLFMRCDGPFNNEKEEKVSVFFYVRKFILSCFISDKIGRYDYSLFD